MSITSPDVIAVPSANRGASFPVSSFTVAGRTVKKFARTPQLIVAGTVQGAMFLLIFRYVFGGAVSPIKSLSYVDFLVPGFVVTSVLFSGMGSSAGIAEDMQAGLFDRLRSLPISRLSVVVGRVLADTALVAWSLVVTIAIGMLVGFRVDDGTGPALAAFGLCMLYGFAFCWLFNALGLYSGSPQAAQSLSLFVFPLSFVSSAYVPVATMPGWMQWFAENQPITPMTNAVRILTQGQAAEAALGHPLNAYLPVSLLWCVALVAVFAPLSVTRYRRG